MNRLGASSPTKALRRGGGSGGHVSDVVDVRENKSTNPATMAMHRLTMSLGSWPSSNCCCHPFQTDGLHHLRQKGRCCWCCRRFCSRLPTKHRHQQPHHKGRTVRFVASEHRSRKKKEQQGVRCPDGSLGSTMAATSWPSGSIQRNA